MYLAGQAQVHTYCYCDGSSYFQADSLWINTIGSLKHNMKRQRLCHQQRRFARAAHRI